MTGAHRRLRFVAPLRPKTPPVTLHGKLAFLPMDAIGDDGTYDQARERDAQEISNAGYTYFEEGDVIRARVTPCFENGKGAYVPSLIGGRGLGTTELFVFRPSALIHPPYLYYAVTSSDFTQRGTATIYGAHGVKRVEDSFARDYRVWLPSVSAQRSIADYLDRATGRIDALIATKQAMIERIGERRAATISEAVSPVTDRFGWQLLRLRRLVKQFIDTEHKTAPFYEDGEYLVIRTNNVSRGRLVVGDGSKFTNADGFREWTVRGVPQAGDLLFTREAPAGEACIVPNGLKACVGQRCVLIKLDLTRLSPAYANWALYGGVSRSFIDTLSQGSTLPHLNMADIADIPLWVPTMEAQARIGASLSRVLDRFDRVVDTIANQTVLLAERRHALITAAITGELDVPGVAA